MVRFVELPQVLWGRDPCWAPPVMAWERFRLDPRRNPYFERGDAAYLMARRRGAPTGRLVAHVPAEGAPGRFGFPAWSDDADVAAALVEAARLWLSERGCRSMVGPLSFEPDDEPGLLLDGHDEAGATGRPWSPRWLAGHLLDLGMSVEEEQPFWRVDLVAGAPPQESGTHDRSELPGQAGPYGDSRLVVGEAAAVPDLSGALRTSSLRGAWGLARRARAGDWEACTVVRWGADREGDVRLLAAAAGAAGYHHLVGPAPAHPEASPVAVHARLRLEW